MEPSDVTLRSLNAEFIRKGIVASDSISVDPRIKALIEALKESCQLVCQNTRDISSSIQLWKERSLHQTLQTLDVIAKTINTTEIAQQTIAEHVHENHIQAIESHDKAAREIAEFLRQYTKQTWGDIHARIDAFSVELVHILCQLIRPDLEEQLAREQAIVRRMVEDKQQMDAQHAALSHSNEELAVRIKALEEAPDGGGDAILCRKLRSKVQILTAERQELVHTMEKLEKEHAYALWEAEKLQQKLELQQATLNMTMAMHQKETKQLVDLVQTKQAQFMKVMTATNTTHPSNGCQQLEMYDPLSGKTIAYTSICCRPKSESPSRSRSICSPTSSKRRHVSPQQSTGVEGEAKQLPGTLSINHKFVGDHDGDSKPPLFTPIGRIVRPFTK